jgi:ketosteroid isomerase-like protein
MTMSVSDNTAVENEIRKAERALYEAMIANDGPALAALASDDLVYVHSTAVAETKDEWLAGVARGHYDYKAISSRGVKIKAYGEAAVMYGIVDMSVATGGGPDEMLHLQFVLVWAREAGRWRLTLRQTTRIP